MLMVGLALRAEAAVLAPSKPSQVVTLTGAVGVSAACPSGVVAGRMVDTQHNPDGTSVPFNVPVGDVFVVTSWEWSGAGSASSTIGMGLVLVDSAATFLGTFSKGSAASDSAGFGGGTVVIPSGFVVNSGISMCYAGGGASASVIVHGFFAKDR
jgi:hypothetical protein